MPDESHTALFSEFDEGDDIITLDDGSQWQMVGSGIDKVVLWLPQTRIEIIEKDGGFLLKNLSDDTEVPVTPK